MGRGSRIWDLRFTIYDLRFTICDLRFAICDLRFAIHDLRFTICGLRLRFTELTSKAPRLKGEVRMQNFAGHSGVKNDEVRRSE